MDSDKELKQENMAKDLTCRLKFSDKSRTVVMVFLKMNLLLRKNIKHILDRMVKLSFWWGDKTIKYEEL